VGAGVVLLTIMTVRSMNKDYARIAADLGGEVVNRFFVAHHVRLLNHGFEARIEMLFGGNRNNPPLLVIRQKTDLDFSLSIAREGRSSRALKKAGLLKEVVVGEPEFDRKYLIKSSAAEAAARFLSSPERRRLVDEFFGQEFNLIAVSEKQLSVEKPNYHDRDLDAENLKKYLEQIFRFIEGAA